VVLEITSSSAGSPWAAPAFISVNGEAVSADGHAVSFNLYMGQNARGTSDNSRVFGGSFVVT